MNVIHASHLLPTLLPFWTARFRGSDAEGQWENKETFCIFPSLLLLPFPLLTSPFPHSLICSTNISGPLPLPGTVLTRRRPLEVWTLISWSLNSIWKADKRQCTWFLHYSIVLGANRNGISPIWWGWVEASPFGWDLRDSGVHFDYYSPELSTLLVLSYLILLAILYFHFMVKILRFKKAKEIA